MKIKYGSLCSGIEAATVAWHQLGWVPAWYSEIDKFASAVLMHHYPHIPNLGDMTLVGRKIENSEIDAPDVLVAGTPCQAFSIAGLRNSLSDQRGQLTLECIRIINTIDSTRLIRNNEPAVFVWENVRGVLNTKDNAFGNFIGGLAGAGCELHPAIGTKWPDAGVIVGPQRTIAWRVFNAEYFGLAQRRQRVFLVASARKGFDPAEVLFEFGGVRRDIAPRRDQEKETTGTIRAGIEDTGYISAIASNAPVRTLCAGDSHGVGNQMFWEGKVIAQAFESYCMANGQSRASINYGICPTLTCNHEAPIATVYAIPGNWVGRSPQHGGNGVMPTPELSPCLTTTDRHAVAGLLLDNKWLGVRRLTPLEYERLQGFPDNYTRIAYRNKPVFDCPDSPRYKALGNSMPVPVMAWIGQRIDSYLKTGKVANV